MGIRRIFRDSENNVPFQFNKEVSVESTVHEDLIVFRGILVAVALRWALFNFFMFESDS